MKGIGIDTNEFAEIKETDDLVRESVNRILFTRPRERVNNSSFGFGLEKLLFNPNSIISQKIKEDLVFQIQNYEPRIEITQLTLSQISLNKIRITMRYIIKTLEFEEREIVIER